MPALRIVTRSILHLLVVLGLMAGLAAPAAAEPRIYQSDGYAIGGYDAVAYHSMGKPVEGSSAHTVQWQGATWRFANADNRDAFAADPERYAPQYNGYCAWAAASGYLASTDPEAWEIVNGKLYMNYSRSVHSRWTRNKAANIAKGDENWPEIQRKFE